MKPYYSDERATVYHGDCREILPSIACELLVTDPPYGIDFDTDYSRFSGVDVTPGNTYLPVRGDNEPFDPRWLLEYGKKQVIWGANCFSDKLPRGSWLIWDKRFKNGKAFLADAEAAWLSTGHGIYLYSVTSQGFLRPEPIDHPTQKPHAVMEWCIYKANQPGMICDPFCGTGSTLTAAKMLGRQCIGIEIEERYCEAAAKRLSQEVLTFE